MMTHDILRIITRHRTGIAFDNLVTKLQAMPQHSAKSSYNVRQSVHESIWKLKNFLSLDDNDILTLSH